MLNYLELLENNDVKGLMEYLKEHDINEELSNQTLLFWATFEGNLSFVKQLVHHGADINKKDSLDRTVVMISCFFGYYEITAFYLENNADTEGCLERAINSWNGEPQSEIIELLKEKLKDLL